MTLSPQQALALAAEPSLILLAQGIAPDPWQRAFLLSPARQALLNCSRQAERWRETQRGVFGMDIWDDDSLWTGL